MENNANQQLNPMLCKRNCGFFGNAAYDGYCSKCYKDHVKRQNSGSAAGRVTPTTTSNTMTTTSALHSSNVVVNEIQNLPPETAITTVVAESVPATTAAAASTTTQPIAIPARTETVSSSENVVEPVQFSLPPEPMDESSSPSATASVSSAVAAAAVSIPTPCIVEPPSASSASRGIIPNTSAPQLSSSVMSTDGSESTLTMMMSTSLPLSASIAAAAAAAAATTSNEKKKRTRCCVESCKRKVGLTGFDCRCGGLFCWEHRYSDKHDCKFDYKEHGQDQIRKNNPIVVGEKIQKI